MWILGFRQFLLHPFVFANPILSHVVDPILRCYGNQQPTHFDKETFDRDRGLLKTLVIDRTKTLLKKIHCMCVDQETFVRHRHPSVKQVF